MTSNASPQTVPAAHRKSSRYPNYTTYKASGVSWLQRLPAGWDTARLKWLFRVVNGATPKTSESRFWNGQVAWATPEDLGESQELYLNSTERSLTQEGLDSCGAGLVPTDSIILSTRAPIGYVRLAGQPTATNQGCRSLIPEKAVKDSRFYYFALQSARPMLEAYGTGATFQELSSTELGLVSLPVPPSQEQRAIARFLCTETERINRLIAKKERLIELLEERRTALITKAVTKGLDPDVPMKESGVEWLGEIPEHWEVSGFSWVIDVREGPGILAKDFRDEGTPLLRIGNLTPSGVKLDGCNFLDPEQVKKKWEHFRVEEGDLVISGSATSGEVSEVGSEAAGAIPYTGIIRLRPDEEQVSRYFLQYFLDSPVFLEQVNVLRQGVAIQHYGPTHLRRITIPVPPIDEQRRIEKWLSARDEGLRTTRRKAQDAIGLLQEYRSALITAAVTGKIDVRDHAA